MTKILGVDYGRKKIGLAVGDSKSKLAEPVSVIKFESVEEALRRVEKVVRVEQVEQVVIGISEGKMADETEKFGKKLGEKFKIPIIFQDETLTTQEAQGLAIVAGLKRKKRRSLQDAYSATLILQNYLESSKS